MEVRIKKLGQEVFRQGLPGTATTYEVTEGEKKFLITCTSHPHLGSRLAFPGTEGTLHIQREDNTVVRQVVALGGGCALAFEEEVVEGLSPASLQAIIDAQRTGDAGSEPTPVAVDVAAENT